MKLRCTLIARKPTNNDDPVVAYEISFRSRNFRAEPTNTPIYRFRVEQSGLRFALGDDSSETKTQWSGGYRRAAPHGTGVGCTAFNQTVLKWSELPDKNRGDPVQTGAIPA